jgi:predicted nuclease of predicted toxin-antitoxin system
MKLLLDESISHRVAEPLQTSGLDVVHVAELSMLGADDAAILAQAAAENRTLVTADTDFGTLLALSGATDPAIVGRSEWSPRGESNSCQLKQ